LTRSRRFTVVEMAGTHYEMGRQYGAQCKELIRGLAARFDGLILKEPNVEAGKAAAREAAPFVREAAPELMEEVEGIADGAGVDFDDVFRMNCSVELFAWQGCIESQSVSTVPAPRTGCSSFALRAKEGTLVAWNMDWWRLWLPYIVLVRGRPNDGPCFMAFAFAGCVGRPGMSEHVAVSANYLPYRGGAAPGVANQWDGPGVPYNFLVRIMLKQRSTEDAAAAAAGLKRMACVNYTVGDASGDIRCIETTPRDYAEIRADADFITHANSYLSAEFDGIREPDLHARDVRTHHAREQLRQAPRPLDRHALASVQTSHFPGDTTGICVHRMLQDRDGITLLSFIGDITARTMWVSYGPPCEHEFLPYELPRRSLVNEPERAGFP